MARTEVLERSAQAPKQKVMIVDCDIHPMPAAWDEIDAYASESAKRDPRRHWTPFPGAENNYAWLMGGRRDSIPAPEETPLQLLRRQVLDEYGVDYGILNFFSFARYDIPELAADGARAANDWLQDTWMDQDPRLLGSIIVPWEHPELAVREITKRASDKRWVQVLMPDEAMEQLGSRKYRPIFEAATAHGLPVARHVGWGRDLHNGTGWPSYTFERHLTLALDTRCQLLNMVCEGLFDAIPDVRIVIIEGGQTWAVSLRWALDSAYELLNDQAGLKRRPSEYLDEHVWFSTQPIEEPDDPAHYTQAIEHGHLTDRLMFATDWPHWDFDSPARALPRSLDPGTRERILARNACELFGLPR